MRVQPPAWYDDVQYSEGLLFLVKRLGRRPHFVLYLCTPLLYYIAQVIYMLGCWTLLAVF